MESGCLWNGDQQAKFQSRLLDWYARNQRALPWRVNPSPYRIWISEVMLQQTQAATVLRYYDSFLRRFPDLNSLAQASEDSVLELWAGLGYYSRARNLLKTARLIAKNNGVFPDSIEEVSKLPGIGKYTAGAICSIAFNRPEPVVDGNIRRVITRLVGIRRRVPERVFWSQMRRWLPEGRASDFNQSMMELGALICTPLNPKCTRCPVQMLCVARNEHIENILPAAAPKARSQRVRIVALLLLRGNKCLLTSGNDQRFIPGKYGLPYEVVPSGGNLEEVGRSLCRRVLGREVDLQECSAFRHTISRRLIFVHGYSGRIFGKVPTLRSVYLWANLQDAPVVSSLFGKMLRS